MGRVALVVSLAALALLAGCGGPDPGEGKDEGDGEQGPDICMVHVGDEPAEYILQLAWSDFAAGAPDLAQDLRSSANRSQPFNLGGLCDVYRDDGLWLIDAFEAEPNATPTQAPGAGLVYYHYEVPLGNQSYQLSLWPRAYRD